MSFPVLALLPVVEKVFDRIFPDPAQASEAKIKLLEMQQSGELAVIAAEADMAKGQMAINQIEAASSDKFAARWRPFIGWVCGVAFAYNLVLQPFMVFVLVATGVVFDAKDLPVIDSNMLGWALGGLLGLGSMRTYERTRGVIPAK